MICKIYIPALWTPDGQSNYYDAFISASEAAAWIDDFVDDPLNKLDYRWSDPVAVGDSFPLTAHNVGYRSGIDGNGNLRAEFFIAVRKLSGSPLQVLATAVDKEAEQEGIEDGRSADKSEMEKS